MILITGATGKIGGAVVQQLLQGSAASNIAVLVRDKDKAAHLAAAGVTVHTGDYGDVASLDAAMQGINKVLLVSGGGGEEGLQQHKNVVDAAKRAGVQCIAYTSRSLRDPDTLVNKLMLRHFETEDYIKESGLNHLMFRNILYMDVLPLYANPAALERGLHLPAGNGQASFALRSEMGEAIANVLLEADCENKTYHFTGSEVYSLDDVAAALSELSCKKVTYNPVTPAEFVERMTGAGQPPHMARFFGSFMQDIAAGQESTVSSDLEEKLGRKPATLREGLKQLYNL